MKTEIKITEQTYFDALIAEVIIIGALSEQAEKEIAKFRKSPDSQNPIARTWRGLVIKSGPYTETKPQYVAENAEFVAMLKEFSA